jgi:hypothetical protein
MRKIFFLKSGISPHPHNRLPVFPLPLQVVSWFISGFFIQEA